MDFTASSGKEQERGEIWAEAMAEKRRGNTRMRDLGVLSAIEARRSGGDDVAIQKKKDMARSAKRMFD